jgi:hypothetical protein
VNDDMLFFRASTLDCAACSFAQEGDSFYKWTRGPYILTAKPDAATRVYPRRGNGT